MFLYLRTSYHECVLPNCKNHTLPHAAIRYEKRPTRRVLTLQYGVGSEGSGRGIRYENWAPRSGSGRVGSGLKQVQEIQCRFRENTPSSDPEADLRGQPTPTSEVNRPDPLTED